MPKTDAELAEISRIVPSSITGRRIEPPESPAGRRGYL